LGVSYIHTPTGTRQADLSVGVTYDAKYVADRYEAIDDRVWMLSLRRLAVLEAFCPRRGRLLDFGCGSGRFVQAARTQGWDAWGYDVTTGAGRRSGLQGPWDVVTFFDSLEHLPDPAAMVSQLNAQVVMVSVPWCHFPENSDWFSTWKHLRPGEHLHHWNDATLTAFFHKLGYWPLMQSSCFEDDYRPGDGPLDNILTAVFRKR